MAAAFRAYIPADRPRHGRNSAMANIAFGNLANFKEFAKILLALSDEDISKAVAKHKMEVLYESKK